MTTLPLWLKISQEMWEEVTLEVKQSKAEGSKEQDQQGPERTGRGGWG